ncbi:heptosyltransferase-1 [Desulfacinum hydrothermale DSM 13146]|uniref:Heptosyltransferase-1 n=1 Tax=Desulfacinum hydrothermale DSM 13146 TaxID=1121390 RepID=A0A1W1X2P9_9BACT|nr:glycosyltransferase family 9 protein [Desulfacinum hydrothermale]SMC17681.1 heptosyltransferase-1 [Desulfacinum hydrothermale DSM 13146]
MRPLRCKGNNRLPDIANPRCILILRPSAIGDVVMASPMVPRLRKAFPHAKIFWLVEPALADLLRHHADLDGIIIWPKHEWVQSIRKGRWTSFLRQVKAFRRRLHEIEPDLVLDVQGLLRSRFLAWLSGAPYRIGFTSKEPHLFLMTHLIDRGPSTKHIGSEYTYLLDKLGLEPSLHSKFPIDKEAAEKAEKILAQEGIHGPYCVLAPFTTRPQKHWLEDRWARVADTLREDFGLPPVLLGGPGDLPSAQRIQKLCRGKIHILCGKSSLLESFAIVTGASLTIGVDTGLTHMAMVQRRPAIALFGATCPYLFTGGTQGRVIYHRLPCSPCKRSPVCHSDYPCMKSITVEEVIRTAAPLIGPEVTSNAYCAH